MAELLKNGSVKMRSGRILWGKDIVQIIDLCELGELLLPAPKVVSSGFQGFGGGGGRGPAGPAGAPGAPGIQGPPGIISLIQDEGFNLPLQNTLNFIGESVSVANDPGNGRLNITINDLYASARIVSNDPTQGTDTTIQDAIDNLPDGGDIYVKPGTYVMPAALTSQPGPISIHGAGIGATILDFGAVAGKFISIDHDSTINLENLTIYAGGLAGQYLYDVSANYLGTYQITLEDVMVGKFADETKSIEGGFLGGAFATLYNVTILVQNTPASYFADAGALTPGSNYLVCFNVACTGTGVFRQKWGGFKNETGLAAFQCGFGCANFASLGYVFASDGTSFVGGGPTPILTASNFSIFCGIYLNDVTLAPGSDVLINACLSGTIYVGTDRIIDIPATSDAVAIVACQFASFTFEAIRNAGTRVKVSGSGGYAGFLLTVVETGAADLNVYDHINFAGSTIIGPNSLVDNENVRATAIDLLLTENARTVKVDATGANRTVTLPPAAQVKWIVYTIKKIDASANTVTIDPDGAELIDGVLTQVLTTQWQAVRIQSDGTGWIII